MRWSLNSAPQAVSLIRLFLGASFFLGVKPDALEMVRVEQAAA